MPILKIMYDDYTLETYEYDNLNEAVKYATEFLKNKYIVSYVILDDEQLYPTDYFSYNNNLPELLVSDNMILYHERS